MAYRHTLASLAIAIFSSLFLAGCGGGSGDKDTQSTARVVSLTISAPATTTKIYKPLQLSSLAVYDSTFTENVTDRAVWTTSDDQVATVENGLVTPVDQGSVAIIATFGGVSHAVQIEIDTAFVQSLTVGTPVVTMLAGATQPITLTSRFADGSVEQVQGFAEFDVDDDRLLSVENGVISAIRSGVTRVDATFLNSTVSLYVVVSDVAQDGPRARAANVYTGTFTDEAGSYSAVAVIGPDGSYRHVVFGVVREWAAFDGYVSLSSTLQASIGGSFYRPYPSFRRVRDGTISGQISENASFAGNFVGTDGRLVQVELDLVPVNVQRFDDRIVGNYVNPPSLSIHRELDPGLNWSVFIPTTTELFGLDTLDCEYRSTFNVAEENKGLAFFDLQFDCPEDVFLAYPRFAGIVYSDRLDESGRFRFFGVSPDRQEFYFEQLTRSFPPPV